MIQMLSTSLIMVHREEGEKNNTALRQLRSRAEEEKHVQQAAERLLAVQSQPSRHFCMYQP